MRTWLRMSPMQTSASHRETWVSKDSPKDLGRSYEVNVRLGKPLDVTSLHPDMAKDFSSYVLRSRTAKTSLFRTAKLERVSKCPICGFPAKNSQFRLKVHGGLYHQCSSCSHCFIINRPTKAALDSFYSRDAGFASAYTNKKTTETRLKQVAFPKAEWTVKQFKLLYGRKPRSVLDVGAGGGQFVYACTQLGMDAQGIELSEDSRGFCKKNFGIDLKVADFAVDWKLFSDIDVVTFWAVLEHLPNPMDFLNAAHKLLSGRKGLVVVEVPRWESMSTAVQLLFPDSIVRHLSPVGHIHCFTDNSLSTALEVSGFAPAAAWYFGEDAFELVTQLSYQLKNNRVVDILAEHISSLQSSIDKARMSDEIVLAGKPTAKPVPIKNVA